LVADWSSEVATSFEGVAGLTNYQTYGHPIFAQGAFVEDGRARLHFCSTETSSEFPGHIEGALAAAERVVDVISGTDAHP